MNIGIIRERGAFDRRVALTPPVVRRLSGAGHTVWVETGAGDGAMYSDTEYQRAGAQIAYSPEEAIGRAELLAKIGRPLAPVVTRIPRVGASLAAMLALAPGAFAARVASEGPGEFKCAQTPAKRRRVALLTGCAQAVLAPEINDAAIRLINRAGIDVVLPKGEGCCGALVHHMGLEERGLAQARVNIDAWMREVDNGGLEAIVITASGCGTTIKDYGFMLRNDSAYAEKAARISALAKDITEYLSGLELPFQRAARIRVTYHSACSMQHGQKVTAEPKALLRRAGFDVRDVPEGHICCGSAGTYNILQPEIAGQLRARKVANIAKTKPDLIAAGNIGCITQIAAGTDVPIVHTAQLLDWACGGPAPESARAALEKSEQLRQREQVEATQA